MTKHQAVGESERPKIYQRMKKHLFFLGLGLDLCLLLILLIGGYSVFIKNIAFLINEKPALAHGIYALIFSLIFYVLHFPLNYFSGYYWEHKFQLSTQSLAKWLIDDIKKSLIGLVLFVLLVEVLYIFLLKYPDYWWLATGGFWVFLSYVMAKLTPNVLIPLFYKYSDLDNAPLKEKIHQLFGSCNVALKNVYSINFSSKTKKANAFLCGLGKGRRVVLSDTLLERFTDEEIEVVIAHELGHYKHKDIIKMLAINSAVIFLGLFLVDQILKSSLTSFGFENIYDIAAFPLLALILIVFGFITTPLLNAYSRWMEVQADRFSIEKTKKAKDFISLMQKLGEMNLSEFKPSFLTEIFFYDHPPISKRIKFAQKFSI